MSVKEVLSRKSVVVGLTSAVSFAGGAATAYFLTKDWLALQFEKDLEHEIAVTKAYYQHLYNKPAIPEEDPKQFDLEEVEEFDSALDDLRYKEKYVEEDSGYDEPVKVSRVDYNAVSKEKASEGKVHEVKRNIFTDAEPPEEGVDWGDEAIDPTKPYVITHDDYFKGDLEYDQSTVTYYENDDTLVDEREEIMQNTDATVGDDNLVKFGFRSNDKNVVYVRNETLEIDYEIVRSPGSYKEEVLGFVEHSDSRGKIRKFRGDDE